ncbi:bifunctional 5,10-methylenetetrahydrofolate dehydrogenase/5,10-methenyltetrahydrofolate cyclohydrolase [Patescibacteria group bacterium]|nr:bifunctional 5,10-methylenetetrahydrofolate dehydrogenase/5,10-methenyltetrahydrofolate cyclohydrolase [Patescibacteria group bacterium]
MKILDGKKISKKILKNLKREIEKKGLKLKLAVIFVGKDPASKIFIREKKKACEFVRIDFELFRFPARISNSVLKKEIKKIVKNPTISGVVIQLPLPEKFNVQEFLSLVPSEKNIEAVSPVVCAIDYILRRYKISLKRKTIVLVGHGRLVGRPLAKWFKNKKIKFYNINKIKKADIIISGVGRPGFITGDMVKKGAVIIDVGFSHNKKRKAAGDVDFKSVSKKASYITPVPGGVGPMTIACLLKNLVWTYTYSNK